MTIRDALKIIERKMTDIEKCAEMETSERIFARFEDEYTLLGMCKSALERQISTKSVKL